MKQNNLKKSFEKLTPKKRRGVAEVISTLLLVVVAVVGAVILTGFLDETFVAGSLSVTSGTDTTQKTIRMTAYDTRNGDDLMGIVGYNVNNVIIFVMLNSSHHCSDFKEDECASINLP